MGRRIKREDTRRTSTVLLVTLNKKTHTVSALESPVYPQKSPIYSHKSPIYPQNSPIHLQKSFIYPQKNRTLSRTGLLQRRR